MAEQYAVVKILLQWNLISLPDSFLLVKLSSSVLAVLSIFCCKNFCNAQMFCVAGVFVRWGRVKEVYIYNKLFVIIPTPTRPSVLFYKTNV